MDELAHDAGVVDKKHHVTGSTTTKSGAQMHKERHGDAGARETKKTVAVGVAKEVLPDIIVHHAHTGAAGGPGAAAAVGPLGVAIGIGIFTYECLHELSAAEKKAEEIRGAFDNDAVNVALAKTLAFDKRFGEHEAAKRPGVNDASARLSTKLNEPNNAMKVVFQSRADEGFAAAARGMAAVSHLPEPARGSAFQQWMKDNGFGDRMANDVAFGKGVEYEQWIHSAQARELGVDPAAESKKVEERQAPPQPYRRAG